MNADFSEILVFGTNIKRQEDKQAIVNLLTKHASITECTIDTEDIDCVLRVVSPVMPAAQVIQLVEQHGFMCRELE